MAKKVGVDAKAGAMLSVTIFLDPQVLHWLKSKGRGHLKRINDILLNLMEEEKAAKK